MARLETLFHGTTATRASAIASSGRFEERDTYFVLGEGKRYLAERFARHAVGRQGVRDHPAIVIVEMEQEDFAQLRRSGELILKSFDAADAPDLRQERQWLLGVNGVRILNRLAAEISWVQI